MKAKCFGCGIEKDLEALEFYPSDEQGVDTTEPITPLMLIECQDSNFKNPYKMCIVCHNCFEKLDPDMWISSDGWKLLNPVIEFENLPETDGDGLERWDITKYIK